MRHHLDSYTVSRFLIQYPQGAMEKTIEPNQSQKVEGITITLERVELSAEGSRFYAFVVPLGYTPPAPGVTPPPTMIPVHAEYSFDSVTKDAGYCGCGTRGDGITLKWSHPYEPLDPVPSDARELTFTITHFGDIEGPWEFKVPLE